MHRIEPSHSQEILHLVHELQKLSAKEVRAAVDVLLNHTVERYVCTGCGNGLYVVDGLTQHLPTSLVCKGRWERAQNENQS